MKIQRRTDFTIEYKLNNNPPGMWTGFQGVLPKCKLYHPRIGIHNYELNVSNKPVPFEDVEKLARKLAWERYDSACSFSDGLEMSVAAFDQFYKIN